MLSLDRGDCGDIVAAVDASEENLGRAFVFESDDASAEQDEPDVVEGEGLEGYGEYDFYGGYDFNGDEEEEEEEEEEELDDSKKVWYVDQTRWVNTKV